MLKKILVPLDGSEMGEKVMPYVETLAHALNATVYLLRVEPSPQGRSAGIFKAAASFLADVQLPRSEGDLEIAQHPVYRENELASLEADAKSTLMPVAEHLQKKGIAVEVAVTFGRPAGAILQYAEKEGMDMIVMSTHGEGGPSPWAFGPTADRVSRRAPIPVMLIRPEEVARILPTTGRVDD